ncbi:MAG: hypothetical protein ACI9IV_000989 [Paracoccaceae bacterium]|jgi:hypothetical protein
MPVSRDGEIALAGYCGARHQETQRMRHKPRTKPVILFWTVVVSGFVVLALVYALIPRGVGAQTGLRRDPVSDHKGLAVRF